MLRASDWIIFCFENIIETNCKATVIRTLTYSNNNIVIISTLFYEQVFSKKV